MFKNKLITALVITIAMLCGIVFFGHTSPSFSTGQIFTLILGALAWLALLFFPSALQQQQQPPLVEASSLSNNFTNLLSDIQTELTGHINATEAELTQIKSIMDNAIDDLVDSFISLEACARIEQKLVMLLATSENVKDNDELNPFREKQLKSKQFLLETSKRLNEMIENAQHNEVACKSLINIELEAEKDIVALEDVLTKLAQTTDNKQLDKIRANAKALHSALTKTSKIVSKLHASSKILVEESTDISQKVTAIISENANNIAMVTDEMAVTATQIEIDVQAAVKSLQFQDMTSQLIVQCGERQRIMQHILNTVNAIGNKDNTADTLSELQAKLIAASNELKQASNVRMKQFNVDAGHVELF